MNNKKKKKNRYKRIYFITFIIIFIQIDKTIKK